MKNISKCILQNKAKFLQHDFLKIYYIQVNCILEAFGHAKTPRNSNSSRFTKLFTIQYCEKRRTMLRGDIQFCLYKTGFKCISNALYCHFNSSQ